MRYMFTQKSRESLESIFDSLDNLKVTAYIKTGSGRHEAERILDKLSDARSDEKPALLSRLNELCNEYEVDPDLLQQLTKDHFLSLFPEKDEILNKLTEFYYNMSRTAPTPSDYISQLTDRLIRLGKFPEFKVADPDEPTRLKILKRYIAGSPNNWKTFDLRYFYRLAAERLNAADGADIPAVTVARCIDDSVFDILNKTEIKSSEMVGLIVKQTDDLLIRAETEPVSNQSVFSAITVSEEIREFLIQFCRDHGIEADTDSVYSLFAALNQSLSENAETADDFNRYGNTLTDKLDEEFRYTLKKVKYTNRNGRLSPAGDLWKYRKRDFINAVTNSALAEDARQAMPLLESCSSIADGYFCRNSRKNRDKLYIYAIMFGMTCDLGVRDVRKNETDISKNLFEDFYCDNMARFLPKDTDISKMETEPDGAAINYKNFIDMIYVYYLMNRTDELPGIRTDKALDVINSCLKKASAAPSSSGDSKKPPRDELLNDRDATYRYRTEVSAIVVNCPEDYLTDTIVRYFSIPKRLIDENIPRVIYSSTAMRDLEELMQDIEESSENNYIQDANESYIKAQELLQQKANKNGNVSKAVAKAVSAEKLRWYIKRQRFNRQFLDMLIKRYPDDKEFVRMVKAISDRVEEFNGVTLKNRLMEAALRSLYFACEPLLSENLTNDISLSIGAEISGDITKAIVEGLISMGFDIERSTEAMRKKAGTLYEASVQKQPYAVNVMDHPPKADITAPIADQLRRTTGTFYQLHSRSYPDNELLQNIMDSMPSHYTHDNTSADNKIIALLRSAGPKNFTVTRSRMLTAVANRYLYGDMDLPALFCYGQPNDMYYFEELQKPSDIFAVFEIEANNFLIESGFQELNPKNLLDMYLFLSILVYFMYNETDR